MSKTAMILLALLAPWHVASAHSAIDGDTARLGGVLVRLAGVDAPELLRPRCPAELALARQARDRLAELLSEPVRIERVRGRDRYGRLLAILRDAEGRDLGQVLIAEGLAVPYQGRGQRQNWCAP